MNNLKKLNILAAAVLSVSIAAMPAFSGTPALPNFHQVNDHIYRGGQPSADAWPSLAKMGIKTVVDLRRDGEEGHSTAEEALAVAAAGLTYVNIPMKGIVAPTEAQVAKALALLNSKDPVFIHCKRGADRTGTIIACYRMSHDGWQHQQALHEAKSLGMSFMEFGMKSYISSFQPTHLQPAITAAEASPVGTAQ